MYINLKGGMIAAGKIGNCKGLRYVSLYVPLTEFSIKAGERSAFDGCDPEAIWISVKCWRDMALSAQYIAKGDIVLVAGKFQSRQYQSKNGETKTSNEITAEFISVQGSVPSAPAAYDAYGAAQGIDFTDISDDDGDTPF